MPYTHTQNKHRYILRPSGEVNADRKLTLYLPVSKQDQKNKKIKKNPKRHRFVLLKYRLQPAALLRR